MRKQTRKRLWIVGLALFITLFAYLAISAFMKYQANRPQDLGSQLEYIGQRNYGCLLWWCESEPTKSYYFATNLTEEQMRQFFKKATYTSTEPGGASSYYYFDDLDFTTVSGRNFYISFYHNIKPSQMDWNLKDTNKLYGISMTDKDYAVAKGAL